MCMLLMRDLGDLIRFQMILSQVNEEPRTAVLIIRVNVVRKAFSWTVSVERLKPRMRKNMARLRHIPAMRATNINVGIQQNFLNLSFECVLL